MKKFNRRYQTDLTIFSIIYLEEGISYTKEHSKLRERRKSLAL